MKIIMKSKYTNIEKGGEKKMKYSKTILALGVAGFIMATLVFLTNTWAVENVRMTKHNLSANPNIGAQGTTEVCIFCHTPHGGETTVAGGAAPLWNRNLSTASYIMYKSPNFDTTFGTTAKPQGVSVACLSCHDGSVAFDSLLNFGGSGSTNNITGFNGSYVNQADKTFKEDVFPPDPYPNLGTDISNDHPISMEIPCVTDPQFKQICDNIEAGENAGRLADGKVSYLYRGDTTLPTDIRDRLRAYPTTGDGKPYIECASCHNPHEASRIGNDGSTAIDTNNSRFLRHPSVGGATLPLPTGITAPQLSQDRNSGSLLCLSCHQK